jgi:hypothetical protein
MAKQRKKRSYGPTAVALLALHDREFFARLLKDPRGAMNQMVERRKLRLTDADIEQVVTMIEERSKTATDDPLVLWDRYHQTGEWGGTPDWPLGLPE